MGIQASATLTDADGNDAALAIPAGASLANSSNFVIDTTTPTLAVTLIGPVPPATRNTPVSTVKRGVTKSLWEFVT
jgi:hypothetical protein